LSASIVLKLHSRLIASGRREQIGLEVPALSGDLERYVFDCLVCQSHAAVHLVSHQIARFLWQESEALLGLLALESAQEIEIVRVFSRILEE